MKNNEELIIKIKTAFDSVQIRTDLEGREAWTTAFMDKLYEIGRKENYEVYTSSHNKIEKESKKGWLFDLVWSDETDNLFKGLKLVFESEWNFDNDEILNDFQKLVVAKADFKILLFQFNTAEKFNSIIKHCIEHTDKKLLNDGKIYFIGSGNNEQEIRIQNLSFDSKLVSI